MDDNCKIIYDTIKTMGKARWKDMETELVPEKMSAPTLASHLLRHLYPKFVQKVKDDSNSSIEYYTIGASEENKSDELTFDLCRNGIQNRGNDVDNPINSEVEILLRISNPTKERVGISKILVEPKGDYIITANMQRVTENEYVNIHSIVIEPEQTELIRLFQEGNTIAERDKKFVEADIVIYNTSNEIMKRIPLKLYIGFMSF